MNFRTNFASLRLCVKLFFIVFLLVIPIYSQSDQVLKAPRKDLLPLVWPYLGNLEESVREQVTTLQNSLTSVAKDPSASDLALSEAYGKLGQIYHAYSLTAPARDCYLNASLLAPKDFRWTYLVARLDQMEGRFENAIVVIAAPAR